MRLEMDLALAEHYKSPSQRARRISEGWFEANMFCPACEAERVGRTPDNTKVVDFVCTECGAEFQLKAKAGRLPGKLRDAAYGPMMRRVLADRSPHFAFVNYDNSNWRVTNLLLVPGHFITPRVIEPCRALSQRARRAGWVGCNILTDAIPNDGRVYAVQNGIAVPTRAVRAAWSRFRWMEEQSLASRGWTTDVLRCVRRLGKPEFTLSEVYLFERELAAQHPENLNVLAKIRQQLQILRDRGILVFLGRGRYRIMNVLASRAPSP